MRPYVLGFVMAMLLVPPSAEIRAANAVAPPDGAKEAGAAVHPYAGLDQKAVWQATERDRRSPTELPGITGSFEHPSPHGPKRSAGEAKPGERARAPFDEPEILCPATGCGYAPDVVLLKLKPEAELLVSAGRAAFTSDALNSLLSENGLDLAEPVFSGVARPRAGSQILRPDGQFTEAPDLT